jgi:thiol-disulfide isomerase/thioredoxin
MLAGAAALALALLTLPVALTSSHAHAVAGSGETEIAAACDTEARSANFDFTLEDMNGNDVAFESLTGKVVLLNFWATWCGPCKIEIPWFVEFAELHKNDGLVVLGLSVDDPVDKIQAFAAEYDVNYPMLVGLGREDFQEAYGPVWGLPTTFFVDREGTLCRTHAGIVSREEFEKDIADLL